MQDAQVKSSNFLTLFCYLLQNPFKKLNIFNLVSLIFFFYGYFKKTGILKFFGGHFSMKKFFSKNMFSRVNMGRKPRKRGPICDLKLLSTLKLKLLSNFLENRIFRA